MKLKGKKHGVTLVEVILVAALLGLLGVTVSTALAPMIHRSEEERLVADLHNNISITRSVLSQDFRRATHVISYCDTAPAGCQLTINQLGGGQVLYFWSQTFGSFRRYDDESGWTKLLDDGQMPDRFWFTDIGDFYEFEITIPTPPGPWGNSIHLHIIATPRR